VHKQRCVPFDLSTTCTLVPRYQEHGNLIPTATITRGLLNIPTDAFAARETDGLRAPRNAGAHKPKPLAVKVRLPYAGGRPGDPSSTAPLHVSTRRRDFVCTVVRADCPAAYDAVSMVVRNKGVDAAKAYFLAELVSQDELVVKIGEVLAEQPF
jgi:hypothetical protein